MREVIVLAGGLGTRLRDIIPDVPKPMAPVGNKPFLEVLLGTLATKGVSRVVLSLGFMAEKISSYFGDRFSGMDLAYVIEETQLGTGGAVRLAMSCCQSDHVFVLNGDTFIDLELEQIDIMWRDHRRPIIVGCQQPDTARYNRLIIEDGKLSGFLEKGATGPGVINAGCYVFSRHQMAAVRFNDPFSLEVDFLPLLLQHTIVDVFISNGFFIDIGVPKDYQLAQLKLAHLIK